MTTRRPEHWAADAGARDVVRLDIPADAARDRTFEIDMRLAVRTARTDATHAMQVRVDGALEWSRSEPTHPGGDSLDLRAARRGAYRPAARRGDVRLGQPLDAKPGRAGEPVQDGAG